MGAQVRDALVKYLKEREGKFFTRDELADHLGTARDSTGAALHNLAKRQVFQRRKRDGNALAYEYTVGKRIGYGVRYAGRKFPYHRRDNGPIAAGESIPAAAGGVGIIIKIEGEAHAIALEQARTLFGELKILFGK